MSKTIQQVHEAAKAFRAQFRPLIEILDEVAELDNLANTRSPRRGLLVIIHKDGWHAEKSANIFNLEFARGQKLRILCGHGQGGLAG